MALAPSDAAFGVMPRAAMNAGVTYCGTAEAVGQYSSDICAPHD